MKATLAQPSILVATNETSLASARLVENGTYRTVLQLRAPSRLIPDTTAGPSPYYEIMGRRIRVNLFKLSSEDRLAILELEVTGGAPAKAGGVATPASVSWDLILTGVIAVVGVLFVGPGVAAAVFALGFTVVAIEKLVRGEPGEDDDIDPPGLGFGIGIGTVLVIAGVALFLWKRQ